MPDLAGPAADGERFTLTILCTANRFRSPIAAGLVHRLAGALPLEVRSAAVSGKDGERVLAQALELAAAQGVDLGGHRARRLGAGELADADLVLGFERGHVAAAVVEGGASRDRTFTLPEFVALAEEVDVSREPDPVQRARALVEAVAERRSASPSTRLAELADPAGGPDRGYRTTAAELERLAERLVGVLFGLSS